MTDGGWSVVRELKRDALGRVELLAGPSGPCVRRVACGNGWPGTRWLGRLLLRRERAALRALAGCPQVPRLLDAPSGAPSRGKSGRDTLLRSWCAGEPLWSASALPADFFAALRALVLALHAHGVCHNDLHKENNILVGEDGRPWLIDFQLASVSRRQSPTFARRCREDLRHVEKHRRRYELADGRAGGPADGRAAPPRSWQAALWARFVKPVYNLITRRVLRLRRSEPRRPRSGPWPRRLD
jgi:serine/threonine protein kinase